MYLSGQVTDSVIKKHDVVIKSTYSDWVTVTTGVLQESVFSPILFNIFIKDLHRKIFFVDDNKLCKVINAKEERSGTNRSGLVVGLGKEVANVD